MKRSTFENLKFVEVLIAATTKDQLTEKDIVRYEILYIYNIYNIYI
jgi:hypothetical protein